ncbi:hypothetical protein KCP77_02910 [Salmonella enterica subsp. enterica]|nr:hypothetical protein KCP77_02910 [Salmonella enterica subsp. enterica]
MLYPACISSPDRIHRASFGIHSSFTTTRRCRQRGSGWSMMAKRVNNRKPVPVGACRACHDLRRVA